MLYVQGIVQTGSSFYHPASGLTVRQLSVSADGGSATLTVCRNSTAAETGALCFNGLDDDCDGLADADDPSCAAARPPPPMLMAGSSVAVSPPPVASPPPPSPPPPPPPLAGVLSQHCTTFASAPQPGGPFLICAKALA